MERRLDKIDPQGMKDRLRRKCDMLEQMENSPKSIKNNIL